MDVVVAHDEVGGAGELCAAGLPAGIEASGVVVRDLVPVDDDVDTAAPPAADPQLSVVVHVVADHARTRADSDAEPVVPAHFVAGNRPPESARGRHRAVLGRVGVFFDDHSSHRHVVGGRRECGAGDAGFHEAARRIVCEVDRIGLVVEEPGARTDLVQPPDMPQPEIVDEQLLAAITAGVASLALSMRLSLLRLHRRYPVGARPDESRESPGARQHCAFADERVPLFGPDRLEAVEPGLQQKNRARRVAVDLGLNVVAGRDHDRARRLSGGARAHGFAAPAARAGDRRVSHGGGGGGV